MFEKNPGSFDDRENFQKQEKALRDEAQKVIRSIEEGRDISIRAVEVLLVQNIERLKNTSKQEDLDDMATNAEKRIRSMRIDAEGKIEIVLKELYNNIDKLKSRFNIIKTPSNTQRKQTMHTKGAQAFDDPDADEKIAKELKW